MLYVSRYDKASDMYGVTDTDDNTTEMVSSAELFSISRNQHLKIHGVNLGQMQIKVMRRPDGGSKKPAQRKPASTQTREQFLEQEVGFDYIVERREARDFTEFVTATGGDVCTYRVYGTAGAYKVYSK